MTRITMKSISSLSEKDLIKKITSTRADLRKLLIDSAMGTIRKESGKITPLRRDIARMKTQLNELRRN